MQHFRAQTSEQANGTVPPHEIPVTLLGSASGPQGWQCDLDTRGRETSALRFNCPSDLGVAIEGEVLVDRADGGRTLADRGRDPFGRSGADVADSEQSGMTGFKWQRGASERTPRPIEVLTPDGSIGEHKPSIVDGSETRQPFRGRVGANK